MKPYLSRNTRMLDIKKRGRGKRVRVKGKCNRGIRIMAGRHKGNGHDAHHVTKTPDVSHIKNPDVTHEASDVNVSGILKFVMGLTVLGAAVFVLMWGMFRFLSAQETVKEPPAGPMAMTEEERLP